jgi:hypothetical protein
VLAFLVFLVGPSCCDDHFCGFEEHRGEKAIGDRGLRVGEEIQRRRGTGLTNKMFGKGGGLDSGNDACTRREGRE